MTQRPVAFVTDLRAGFQYSNAMFYRLQARRHGHNEVDELSAPSQPLMYLENQSIRTRKIYRKPLNSAKSVATLEDVTE